MAVRARLRVAATTTDDIVTVGDRTAAAADEDDDEDDDDGSGGGGGCGVDGECDRDIIPTEKVEAMDGRRSTSRTGLKPKPSARSMGGMMLPGWESMGLELGSDGNRVETTA